MSWTRIQVSGGHLQLLVPSILDKTMSHLIDDENMQLVTALAHQPYHLDTCCRTVCGLELVNLLFYVHSKCDQKFRVLFDPLSLKLHSRQGYQKNGLVERYDIAQSQFDTGKIAKIIALSLVTRIVLRVVAVGTRLDNENKNKKNLLFLPLLLNGQFND